MTEMKFTLGNLMATPGVLDKVPATEIGHAVSRHHGGDWGEVNKEDWEENELSLREGFRLLSAYTSQAGIRFWVITEADRSVTTVLLPEEY